MPLIRFLKYCLNYEIFKIVTMYINIQKVGDYKQKFLQFSKRSLFVIRYHDYKNTN